MTCIIRLTINTSVALMSCASLKPRLMPLTAGLPKPAGTFGKCVCFIGVKLFPWEKLRAVSHRESSFILLTLNSIRFVCWFGLGGTGGYSVTAGRKKIYFRTNIQYMSGDMNIVTFISIMEMTSIDKTERLKLIHTNFLTIKKNENAIKNIFLSQNNVQSQRLLYVDFLRIVPLTIL